MFPVFSIAMLSDRSRIGTPVSGTGEGQAAQGEFVADLAFAEIHPKLDPLGGTQRYIRTGHGFLQQAAIDGDGGHRHAVIPRQLVDARIGGVEQLRRELPVTPVHLDELWSFIARKQAIQAASDGESPDESTDGHQWVWVSLAPEFRLLLAAYVGPRTFQSALTRVPDGGHYLWRALFLQ